ncbi:MAG: cytochrome c biogenesis protein CcdA [Spirochaetaceae bacterium]|nr:MAG: cytochrome c biogenesis protein CcdA [Spirochaetaceae bacterium]
MGDLNIFIALAAGVLSFISPCVLPLVPSYLSFVGGVTVGELQSGTVKRAVVFGRTLFFVLGFTIIFVALGLVFSGSGILFGGVSRAVDIAAGIVVIVLGLNIVFDFAKFLQFERRFRVTPRGSSYGSAVAIGMAFGAGWTPCIGPILAGILFLAGSSGRLVTGATYLTAYSIGLGIPFLLAGFFFVPVMRRLEKVKRHLAKIRVTSGVFLVAVGTMIAMGRFQRLNAWVISSGTRLRRWDAANPETSRVVFVALAIVIALPFVASAVRSVRARGDRAFPYVATAFTTVLIVIAALQASGVINLAEIVSQWLVFQGV